MLSGGIRNETDQMTTVDSIIMEQPKLLPPKQEKHLDLDQLAQLLQSVYNRGYVEPTCPL